ncbi:MAG: GNAT family N-acetyltransferase [Anaerolineae bacterium]|nr:GNAT family N-acetyltransferase [Anaerolineae bacterium]
MNIRTIDEGRHHKREMLINDQVVCWLWAIDYQMRIGSTQVRMGGIGGVETVREHRMKGYMRVLFEDTVQYLVAEGYDVSMLFGIPNFYTKFGYAVCLPTHKQVVQTRDAEEAKPRAGIKPVALESVDMGAVCELYNANNAQRTGTLVRFPEHFTQFSKGTWWGRPAEAIALKDKAGKLLAYAAYDKADQVVNVVEVEAVDDELFPFLLYAFAEQAIEKRCGEINLHHPPDHPFAEYVQRFGCTWETECPRWGGGMMRAMNIQTLFDKIKLELERRLDLGPSGSLALKTDIGTVVLRIQDGRLCIDSGGEAAVTLEVSQDKLTQMLVGYRSVRDVLSSPGVKATGNVLPWLDALFPRGYPYVWLADHF